MSCKTRSHYLILEYSSILSSPLENRERLLGVVWNKDNKDRSNERLILHEKRRKNHFILLCKKNVAKFIFLSVEVFYQQKFLKSHKKIILFLSTDKLFLDINLMLKLWTGTGPLKAEINKLEEILWAISCALTNI